MATSASARVGLWVDELEATGMGTPFLNARAPPAGGAGSHILGGIIGKSPGSSKLRTRRPAHRRVRAHCEGHSCYDLRPERPELISPALPVNDAPLIEITDLKI